MGVLGGVGCRLAHAVNERNFNLLIKVQLFCVLVSEALKSGLVYISGSVIDNIWILRDRMNWELTAFLTDLARRRSNLNTNKTL